MRLTSFYLTKSATQSWSVLAVLVLALLVTQAQAGQFSVSPVRIYMTTRDRATAVTITNEGDTELLMQADIYQWRQTPEGQDDLQLSEDMILSPPILKIAPRARQVLRLASLRPVLGGAQQTYRLIVREIPEAQTQNSSMKLQIAMAFSLPVFISPPGTKRDLQCSTERGAASSLRAVCRNQGNAYTQALSIVLQGVGGARLGGNDAGGYILPGGQRGFDLSAPSGVRIPPGVARLLVRDDSGTVQNFDLIIPD